MAQDKSDILKAFEEEMKRDEGTRAKGGAGSSPAAATATSPAATSPAAAKPAAPAKNSLLDALLSDARAEADREIQQHNQRVQQRVDGQKKAEEEEERRKRLQYEQLFEEEKRKRQDAIRKKEDEKVRKEREAELAEQRRLEAIAKAEAETKARRVRIYVGTGIAATLGVCAILVFVGVIPLLPSDKPVGQKQAIKDTGYVPPPPYKSIIYRPAKGEALFVASEKPKRPEGEGAGIEVLNAVKDAGFRVDGSIPAETSGNAPDGLVGTAKSLALAVARDFKVEKAPGPDNSIKIKDIFK